MNNRIQELEDQLADAKRASTPVIVEETERTKDKVTYQSSNGTVRTDFLGGVAPQYDDDVRKPLRQVLASPWVALPDDIGKVKSEDDVQRTSKLKSGAIRVDQK